MKKELKDELKKQIYTIMLNHPTKSDPEISRLLSIPRSTVWKIRKSLLGAIDHEIGKKVAGQFLTEFQMASDYFKLQMERLEELKSKSNIIITKDGDKIEVPLSAMEILAIEKQQTELWKNLLEFAGQGKVLEVMRLIQSGKIPLNGTDA